jgi:DNA-binding FadR family transcriptional regulator
LGEGTWVALTKGNQIRVPKAAEIIAQQIRKSIVRGELKEGDYLPSEAQLLTDYEVSRPTLREAIRILEVEGLLSISRGARRGARIERPSVEIVTKAAGVALQLKGATIGDVYTARMLIEPAAARMAAEHRPKLAAAVLYAQIEREFAATELPELNDVRQEIAIFHELLMEQSGNITLAVVAAALKELVDRHQALVYSRHTNVPERLKQIRWGLRSHERLAALIEAGDGPGAEAHWLKHMKNASNFWLGDVADTSVVDILD